MGLSPPYAAADGGGLNMDALVVPLDEEGRCLSTRCTWPPRCELEAEDVEVGEDVPVVAGTRVPFRMMPLSQVLVTWPQQAKRTAAFLRVSIPGHAVVARVNCTDVFATSAMHTGDIIHVAAWPAWLHRVVTAGMGDTLPWHCVPVDSFRHCPDVLVQLARRHDMLLLLKLRREVLTDAAVLAALRERNGNVFRLVRDCVAMSAADAAALVAAVAAAAAM